eukprot:9972311-Alexandrium_andersonii.AAC.1
MQPQWWFIWRGSRFPRKRGRMLLCVVHVQYSQLLPARVWAQVLTRMPDCHRPPAHRAWSGARVDRRAADLRAAPT